MSLRTVSAPLRAPLVRGGSIFPTMVRVQQAMTPPDDSEDWRAGALPAAGAQEWLGRPDCGAVVLFSGTARDHSDGRQGVDLLSYEAYESQAGSRIRAVCAELRRRWPAVGRVVILHRTGDVPLGESAVVVGVSAPHRDEAFAAARYGIDAVKACVPIWKRERWEGGDDWGVDGADLVDPRAVGRPAAGAGEAGAR
jgi:molybdopterin synthase catalytic subunit